MRDLEGVSLHMGWGGWGEGENMKFAYFSIWVILEVGVDGWRCVCAYLSLSS